jgi:glycosyltransferase involved in cell wall biosynthesis
MTTKSEPKHLRLLALLQAKNEEHFLPGWLENIDECVDGIVALDDGSSDRTAEILQAHPQVLEILHNPPGGAWNERANQMALVQAGRKHRANWFLCLDADERVESQFVKTAQELLQQADADGVLAYHFHLRDLWGDADHYRVDGIWNSKSVTRLFKNVPEHKRFDLRQLHRVWMPLEIVANLEMVGRHSHLNIYHLSMITAQGRWARVNKYEQMDPAHRFQPIGYRYLADETNLAVQAIPEGREFFPRHELPSAVTS